MPTTSLIKKLLELATDAQVRLKGGWPIFDLAPVNIAVKEDSPQDPGLPALLKDYGKEYLGTSSPRLVICCTPVPRGEELEYLKKWLGAIQLDLERDCFLVGGPDSADELGDLRTLIDHLKPKSLLVLGSGASSVIVGSRVRIEALRDQVREFGKIPMVITYDPASVLADPNLKRPVWKDLQRVEGLIRYG